MKPAQDWADEFLNKHVLNVRSGSEFKEFVESIQRDAVAGQCSETAYAPNPKDLSDMEKEVSQTIKTKLEITCGDVAKAIFRGYVKYEGPFKLRDEAQIYEWWDKMEKEQKDKFKEATREVLNLLVHNSLELMP